MGAAVDEWFTKPGAIPFNWEIRPGVPKHHHHHHHHHDHQYHVSYSTPTTPQKLAPPPSRSRFSSTPSPELRTPSDRSISSLRLNRYRYEPPALARRPELSSGSGGCFLAPWWLRWKRGKKRSTKRKLLKAEPVDYTSELETLARWSMSTRKSMSPSSSSSFSSISHRSSPRPVTDADWAGFGLF